MNFNIISDNQWLKSAGRLWTPFELPGQATPLHKIDALFWQEQISHVVHSGLRVELRLGRGGGGPADALWHWIICSEHPLKTLVQSAGPLALLGAKVRREDGRKLPLSPFFLLHLKCLTRSQNYHDDPRPSKSELWRVEGCARTINALLVINLNEFIKQKRIILMASRACPRMSVVKWNPCCLCPQANTMFAWLNRSTKGKWLLH